MKLNKPRLTGTHVISTPAYKAYYLNGKLHREDGPALTWVTGDKEYWLHGKQVTLADMPNLTLETIAIPRAADPMARRRRKGLMSSGKSGDGYTSHAGLHDQLSPAERSRPRAAKIIEDLLP